MLVVVFLIVLIVVLMVLLGYVYRSDNSEPHVEEPDRRLDRLAMILDADVMEEIIRRARTEGCSEVDLLNRALREGLGNPPRS